jgi:hypothetical protein
MNRAIGRWLKVGALMFIAVLVMAACKGPVGIAGAKGDTGAQGTQGQDGTPGTQGTPGQDGAPGTQGTPGQDGAAGVGVPGRRGMIDDVIINDVDDKVGPAKLIMAADYFVDDDELTYTAKYTGNIVKSVTVDADMPGKFVVTVRDIANIVPASAEDLINETYDAQGMVTVTATDPDGLWATQVFNVLRNRAPRMKDTIAPAVAIINLGITKETNSHRLMASDLFDDDMYDELTLVSRVADPRYISAEVDRGMYVDIMSIKPTEAGEDGEEGIKIRFSATDLGELPAPDEAEITIIVHDGPKVKEVEDVRRPLNVVMLTIPLGTLIEEATTTVETTYEASSTNRTIASVNAVPTSGVAAGDGLIITLLSLGTTEISVTATQVAGSDGEPEQMVTLKFNLVVE